MPDLKKNNTLLQRDIQDDKEMIGSNSIRTGFIPSTDKLFFLLYYALTVIQEATNQTCFNSLKPVSKKLLEQNSFNAARTRNNN